MKIRSFGTSEAITPLDTFLQTNFRDGQAKRYIVF